MLTGKWISKMFETKQKTYDEKLSYEYMVEKSLLELSQDLDIFFEGYGGIKIVPVETNRLLIELAIKKEKIKLLLQIFKISLSKHIVSLSYKEV